MFSGKLGMVEDWGRGGGYVMGIGWGKKPNKFSDYVDRRPVRVVVATLGRRISERRSGEMSPKGVNVSSGMQKKAKVRRMYFCPYRMKKRKPQTSKRRPSYRKNTQPTSSSQEENP
jgi:hypothetical protein